VSDLDSERLLLFELSGHVYGLPIDGILEVVEAGDPCGVPTLPGAIAGVMNWHGEALPVVAPHVLVAEPERGATDGGEPNASKIVGAGLLQGEVGLAAASVRPTEKAALCAEQVLVLADRAGEVPKLGLPIDAVLGLADASSRTHANVTGSVVRERRSIDGRVVSVLDPRRLVARARSVIEDMAA